MGPPSRSAEQRAADLAKAAAARRTRAQVKERLKRGGLSLSEVLSSGESDDMIGNLRVAEVVASMPGVGKIRAQQVMQRLGIAPNRRLRGLGGKQRAALEREFSTAE